jgi:2-phosphosulfolactate phosphatase
VRFKRLSLEACADASGTVVVVDVIRAFTVAAYAFAAGARDIALVDTVEEALRLRECMPDSLALGEVGGLRPEGFDRGNSPSELANLDLSGRHLIQRTSAGTQGAVCCSERADHLLACSLCCAGATALYVKKLAPTTVTFVITGISAGSAENDGDEDMACADYVEGLLRGEPLDTASVIHRVRNSYVARTLFNSTMPGFPVSDIEYCVDVDRFDFAMRVRRENGLPVMKPVQQTN